MLQSLFITGTDTGVGKTHVSSGLAITLRKMGIDVGVMKPFAAGTPQKTGSKSEDAQMLCNAAGTSDLEDLVNPQFFPIPASPYTAWKRLGMRPDIETTLSAFRKLTGLHSMLLVEGMGGIMTPILKNYHIADLILEMKIPSIIVTGTRIGTINHALMTVAVCQKYNIPINGIIINDLDSGGYDADELSRDLKDLTGVPILGTVPFIKDMGDSAIHETFRTNLDMKQVLG